MARRSRMSMLKRQREIQKAEKAARKRAKRHGTREGGLVEPRPTMTMADFEALPAEPENDGDEASEAETEETDPA